MSTMSAITSEVNEKELSSGVRIIALNLPEDEGEGLGFRLTRTLWDPYPWVREVSSASRADVAGLRAGDCILQADGKDLLGLPVGEVARIIRGDGSGRGVSLLVWSCGVDPREDPELLWSCGGGARGERARRALTGVVRALSCCVCSATARRALSCARSHLYCEGCWSRLERCALCREPLPAKDSPYARNLVAEQVFEAIATEYELKDTLKKPTQTVSARTSPNISPSASRKGQYQISMIQKTKKTVQFGDRFKQNYASDPILSQTANQESQNNEENCRAGNSDICQNCQKCTCQNDRQKVEAFSRNIESNKLNLPRINIVQDSDDNAHNCSANCRNIPLYGLQHKLVARLRTSCSLADLNSAGTLTCGLSRSLTNFGNNCDTENCHGGSLDNIKSCCGCTSCGNSPIVLMPYLLRCEPEGCSMAK